MAEKDGDLMEQVRNVEYDKHALFEMCKKQVLNVINDTYFEPNDPLLFNKLFKYFNLSFSQEIQDLILTGKYRVPPELLDEKANNAIQELLKQEYFLYKDYENRICYAPIKIHTRWLIDENNFEKTLCNFFKAAYLFCDNQIQYNDIVNIMSTYLTDYYEIKVDNKAEFGIRIIPKHNIELLEATEKLAENEPSLRKALDFMYACDYVNALEELALLLEPKRQEYKEKIQKGNETLFDIDKFFNFVNNYGIRHNNKKQKQVTEEQLKVHLDFGLSIYRLFTIYGDL